MQDYPKISLTKGQCNTNSIKALIVSRKSIEEYIQQLYHRNSHSITNLILEIIVSGR